MNTTNQNVIQSQTQLAEHYRALSEKKFEEIVRYESTSQDTAMREGANHSALSRAKHAAETNKVFLSGYGKGVLILGISALSSPEKVEKFIHACAGWKS